jgi:hypothetical protein
MTVAKVTINGEVFEWDFARKPLSEALALENALKCRYTDWETDLQAGSARAVAGFVWLVWRRNGRDVPIDSILSGAVEVDLEGLNIEADEGETDPTSPPPERSGTTASNT